MADDGKVATGIVLNGRAVRAEIEPRMLLVEFIREVAGLTGTHVGCDTSYCGACTVLLDGRSVNRHAASPSGSGQACSNGRGSRITGRAQHFADMLCRAACLAVRLLYARFPNVGNQSPLRKRRSD